MLTPESPGFSRGECQVTRQGKADPYQLSFADDAVLAPQKSLTEAVHAVNPDICFFAQISHAGVNTSPHITGEELVSASALSAGEGTSRPLSVAEIRQIETLFAAADCRPGFSRSCQARRLRLYAKRQFTCRRRCGRKTSGTCRHRPLGPFRRPACLPASRSQ